MTGAEAKAVDLLERIAVALERIAVAVERFAPLDELPPADLGCDHRLDYRLDFSGMHGPDEWECAVKLGGCGYHYRQPAEGS